MATKPKPTVKAPASKPRRYSKEEIDAINKVAPQKIDEMNEKSLRRTKNKLEREKWNREYKRKLV